MTQDFKLTVIMSNYNQAHLIGGAIDSFLSQKTDFPVQLIITDDHSTKDNSVEIIRGYEQKHPEKIRVLYNQENGRYLKNILRAKSITKTPYFTLLDADDYWTDDHYLQKAVDFLEKNQDYAIYNANVLALYEDGHSVPYIKTHLQSADFSIDDFINDKIIFSQTTGMVFRNCIYINGIPDIVKNAVGTISERSFEGDADRYIMHLKYGKAHFVNEISGVYRILSTGIWAGMNTFEKCAIQAQSYLDYDIYFDKKYHAFFMNKVWNEIKRCISCLYEVSTNQDLALREEAKEKFANCLLACMAEREVLDMNRASKKKIKFKYKLFLFLYNLLGKKLRRKGLI